MKVSSIAIVILMLFGCGEKYHGAKKICKGKFYVEFYTEWSDMGVCYLTDSINFKIKVDRYNVESEYFEFLCKSDSLFIELWSNYPLPKHILKKKAYKTITLIEEGKLK